MPSSRDWYGTAHIHFFVLIVHSDIFINDQTTMQMNLKRFNKGKCEILWLAKSNPVHYYQLGPARSKQICSSSWGILAGVSLNINQQCNLAIIQAVCALCYIRRSITYRVGEIILLSDTGVSEVYGQTLVLLQERGQQTEESRIGLLCWWGC